MGLGINLAIRDDASEHVFPAKGILGGHSCADSPQATLIRLHRFVGMPLIKVSNDTSKPRKSGCSESFPKT